MDVLQVSAMYDYLRRSTPNRQIFLQKLQRCAAVYDSPENTTLLLPLYSMGMSAGAITPRIEWLRQNGWTLPRLVAVNAQDIETIAAGILANGALFGMPDRIRALSVRAGQISAFGLGELQQALQPVANWGCRELLHPLTVLRRFEGVGSAAALHILMELNWGVVKPDRHICRFLSRLGGWLDFFLEEGATTINDDARLPMLEAWRVACSQIAQAPPFQEALQDGFPPTTELTPRQIDFLIMLFTQTVSREEQAWRSAPLCTSTPICDRCSVPGCQARRAQFVQ